MWIDPKEPGRELVLLSESNKQAERSKWNVTICL